MTKKKIVNSTSVKVAGMMMTFVMLLSFQSFQPFQSTHTMKSSTDGSEIVLTFAASNNKYCLHFKDGYIHHNGYGNRWFTGTIVNHPLNETESQKPSNYLISSTNDSSYSIEKHPLAVNRKTKGTDWMGVNSYIKEHWIYLNLPTPFV